MISFQSRAETLACGLQYLKDTAFIAFASADIALSPSAEYCPIHSDLPYKL